MSTAVPSCILATGAPGRLPWDTALVTALVTPVVTGFVTGLPGSGGGGAAAAPLQALMSQGTSLEPADEALTSSQGKALGAVCVVLVLAALYSSSIGI